MNDPTRSSALGAEAKEKYAESAAVAIEELVYQLKEDKSFAEALSVDPRGTLDGAGIKLEKEAIELLIARDPDRFDRACDALFEVLDPDFVSKLVRPSCDITFSPVRSSYDMMLRPGDT